MKTETLVITFYCTLPTKSLQLPCLALSYKSRIHQEYRLWLDVVADPEIDVNALQHQWAKAVVHDPQTKQSQCFQGLITRIILQQHLLRLMICSELSPLFNNRRTGIYYQPTVQDILTTGIPPVSHTDFQWRINANNVVQYPQHFQLTQYLESDAAFWQRTLKRHGAWLNFYQPSTLVVGDQNSVFWRYEEPVPELKKVSAQGVGIYGVQATRQYYPAKHLTAYYYDETTGRTQSSRLPLQAPLEPTLTVDHEVPFNAMDQRQVDRYAQTAVESLQAQEHQFYGYFQGLTIQAGMYLSTRDWLLTAVSYQFSSHHTQQKSLVYQQNHRFRAVVATAYRVPFLTRFEGAEPRYHGILPGVFAETNSKATVTPDAQGRIPLKFPFRYQHFCNGAKARYTRLSLPLNSGDAGVSYPYYQDTEFVVSFANGSLDKPLIRGTAATDQTQHLHAPERQKRSGHVLPQGQELLYTNTLGNTNSIKLGATHQEGEHQSFTLLNNLPANQNPSQKQLDFTQATTANFEHQITGHLTEKAGGSSANKAPAVNLYPHIPPFQFKTKRLVLNDYIDGDYQIHTEAVVSGEIETTNVKSVNPMNADEPALKASAKASANKLFSELTVKNLTGDFSPNATLTVGLQQQDCSVALTAVLNKAKADVIILMGTLTKEVQKLKKEDWLIAGTVTFVITVTATKNRTSSTFEKVWTDIKDYLANHIPQIAAASVQQVFKIAGMPVVADTIGESVFTVYAGVALEYVTAAVAFAGATWALP